MRDKNKGFQQSVIITESLETFDLSLSKPFYLSLRDIKTTVSTCEANTPLSFEIRDCQSFAEPYLPSILFSRPIARVVLSCFGCNFMLSWFIIALVICMRKDNNAV